MKTCIRCKINKPVAEFYAHSQMADGHSGACKECCKRDGKANREAKREQYSAYERERAKDPARRALQQASLRRHKAKYPERTAARSAVGNAIRDGRLAQKPCEMCGEAKSQAHHENYARPLDVRWMCFKCHREHGHAQVVV